MVQLILACLLLLRSLAPTQVNTQSFGRGTAIVFIFGESGLVVASDGLAQNFSSDHSGIVRKEAEPKISVCNKSFLCAMAGVNPAVFPSVGIEYHFREWLPTPSGKKRASLREYADAMEDKARMTFKGLDLLLKSGEPEYS